MNNHILYMLIITSFKKNRTLPTTHEFPSSPLQFLTPPFPKIINILTFMIYFLTFFIASLLKHTSSGTLQYSFTCFLNFIKMESGDFWSRWWHGSPLPTTSKVQLKYRTTITQECQKSS